MLKNFKMPLNFQTTACKIMRQRYIWHITRYIFGISLNTLISLSISQKTKCRACITLIVSSQLVLAHSETNNGQRYICLNKGDAQACATTKHQGYKEKS